MYTECSGQGLLMHPEGRDYTQKERVSQVRKSEIASCNGDIVRRLAYDMDGTSFPYGH